MTAPSRRTIDLNVDAGEGFSHDAVLIRLVTSVNIACGFHAGDAETMASTIRLAVFHRASLGAHVSYPDRRGFGRRRMDMPPARIERMVLYQLGALGALARAQRARLRHLKLHGALYHAASHDPAVARAVARAILAYDSRLIWIGMPHTRQEEAARRLKIRYAREAFVDRRYTARGSLVPRTDRRALIKDPAEAVAQAGAIILNKQARAIDGTRVPLEVDTLCLHSDTPHCGLIARRLRQKLKRLGIIARALAG